MQPQQPGAARNFLTNAAQGFSVTSNQEAKSFFRHPVNTVTGIVTAQRDLGNRAYEKLKRGEYGMGLADLAYSAIPFIGPTLSKSGHQLAQATIRAVRELR